MDDHCIHHPTKKEKKIMVLGHVETKVHETHKSEEQ